ncbi:transcription elongation factor A protein 2-like [Xenopus laevis]|uniref:Transcription elongation factor n=1 Tax=Xenopus laevis TaxID=8355 RepID=A0A8J1LVB7_XENLA|nr:transcription elongation factor A protein 2-like [Xenopus laevis]
MAAKGVEVARIAKKLDKMVAKKSMGLLRELKNIPITLELLQSTHVGISVNALRKQTNDNEIITLSKSLIKSWKKLLDQSEQPGKEKPQIIPSCYKEKGSSKKIEVPKTPVSAKMTRFPPLPVTSDSVRTKCREMLNAALQTDGDPVAIGADCELLAAQIEEVVFREMQNTDMKYKNRIRSRISNLKDSKNPELRKNVLCGIITTEQIAIMSCEEMASNELKEMRKAMTKASIQPHQIAKTGGTPTDLFTCGKCKKKNCTYTQVQTRSADGPMTTFVVCNECGNLWKFC